MLKDNIALLSRSIEDLIRSGEAEITNRLAESVGLSPGALQELFPFLTGVSLQDYVAARRHVLERKLSGYPPLCFEDLADGTIFLSPMEEETLPSPKDLPDGYELICASDYARTAHPDHAAVCRILQALQENGMTPEDFADIWDTARLFGADLFDVIANSAHYEDLFAQISEGALNEMAPATEDDGSFWLGLDL